jgi:hypothetical protein
VHDVSTVTTTSCNNVNFGGCRVDILVVVVVGPAVIVTAIVTL